MNKNTLAFLMFLSLNAGLLFSQDVPSSGHASDYHLIYLDICQSKERKNLTNKVLDLLNVINGKKDEYLLYISNGYKPVLINSLSQKDGQIEDLVQFLQTMNTSYPLLMFDKDSILNIWDKKDIISLDRSGEISLLYKNIYFHYFVSSELFRTEEKELIDNFLMIKDLTRNYIDTKRIKVEVFHNKDDVAFFLERRKELAKSNFTGYEYTFSSY